MQLYERFGIAAAEMPHEVTIRVELNGEAPERFLLGRAIGDGFVTKGVITLVTADSVTYDFECCACPQHYDLTHEKGVPATHTIAAIEFELRFDGHEWRLYLQSLEPTSEPYVNQSIAISDDQ